MPDPHPPDSGSPDSGLPNPLTTPPRPPSKVRFALLVLVFVYPLVTTLLYLSVAITPVMAIWYRTMHVVPVVVVAMVWGIIPFINTRLRRLL